MTWAVLVASAVLAGIAAAGVLHPFRAPRSVALARLADPLDDERRGLLRALRDLDEERATGQLTEDAYRGLRAETEGRAVAVLRALEAGDAKSAVTQYLAVLALDPRNAEAQANLGFVLYEAGRPEDGLRAVEQALVVDPNYPEALYFKGVILLRGLHRPTEAAVALRAYLAAAPFGSHRAEVESLLKENQG